MAEQELVPAKTPETEFFQGYDPKKNYRECVLRLGRDGKIKSDLIAEPQASQQSGDVGKDESDSRWRHAN